MKTIYLKLIFVTLIWGGTFIAARIATAYVSPLTGAALRFLFASIALLILMNKTQSWVSLSRQIVLPLTVMSLTGVALYNIFFFEGLKHISASRASLIIATNPVCALLAAKFFLKEPLTKLRTIGILLSLCGAVIVITQGQFTLLSENGIGLGEIVIFGCVLSWVTYTLVSKQVMKTISPLAATAYSTFLGCMILMILALHQGAAQEIIAIPLKAWIAIAFLGLFGTAIGFYWYLEGVYQLGPTGAAHFINLVPIFAVLLAVLILGESLTPATVIGGGFVVSGLSLTTPRKS